MSWWSLTSRPTATNSETMADEKKKLGPEEDIWEWRLANPEIAFAASSSERHVRSIDPVYCTNQQARVSEYRSQVLTESNALPEAKTDFDVFLRLFRASVEMVFLNQCPYESMSHDFYYANFGLQYLKVFYIPGNDKKNTGWPSSWLLGCFEALKHQLVVCFPDAYEHVRRYFFGMAVPLWVITDKVQEYYREKEEKVKLLEM